jgi:copper transport protein
VASGPGEECIGLMRRRPAAAALAAAVICALAAAPAALAHAILQSSSPANGVVLKQSPSRVTLQFSEAVETAFGSVRVYDANAKRVDSGTTLHPKPSEVGVPVPKLDRGTYTVAWRVISADTHPVHGAFTFSVGAASGNPKDVAAQILASEKTPRYVSLMFDVDRFVNFFLILFVVGGVAVIAFVVRDAALRVRRLIELVVAGAAALLVPASLFGLVLEGAEAGGYSIGSAFRPSVLGSVLSTQFGQVWLARACVAAALAVVLLALPWFRRVGLVLAALLGLGLAASPTAAGHAAAGSAIEWIADGTHVLAAAIWTGGLALTGLALILARQDRWTLASRAVPRLSILAFGSVVFLLIAGTTSAYLEVRAWRGLWQTTYGGLILAKLGLILPLLALGAYNNRFAVPRLRAGIASTVEQRRFLRFIGLELALVVAIVGVTAVLVQQPPAKSAVARTGPFATETVVGPYGLNLVVDPARAGSNAIHLYLLDKGGQPASADEVRLGASLPSAGIGPLRVRSVVAGPGHFVAPAVQLPIGGTWQLQVQIRKGDFDEWLKTVSVPIGKG